MTIPKPIFEEDAQMVIEAIGRPPAGVDWSFGPIIVEIEASLSYFEVWSVYKLNYTFLTCVFFKKFVPTHI